MRHLLLYAVLAGLPVVGLATESAPTAAQPPASTSPRLPAGSGFLAALRATLEHHPALRGKQAEVAAKHFAGDSARAQRYPNLSAQLAAQSNSSPGSLRARQPVWAFGRIDSAIAYADADIQVEQADLLRVRRQLLEQTAVAYAKAHGARLRLAVATDNLVQLEELHERIQRRYGGAQASAADVRLALARLTQGRAQRERMISERQLAQTELEALTQVEVDSTQPVPARATGLDGLTTADALKSRALEHSADLLLKERRAHLAQAEIDRERLSVMPGVYLQADKYLNQPGYAQSLNLGLVLEANLDGMGLASRGRTQGAVARHQAALADRDATRFELERNLKSLLLQRDSQTYLIENQRISVDELQGLLASYQRQYEAGYKTWLDVLNMQRELTEQRLQQVQTDTDWQLHSLRLAVLLGELDDLDQEPTPPRGNEAAL